MKSITETYVPRHERVGIPNYSKPSFDAVVETSNNIDVLDDAGSLVESVERFIRTSVSDYYSKYKHQDFKLSALLEAGVPLSLINMNNNQLRSIDELEDIASKLDSLDEFAQKIESNKKELDSLFVAPSDTNNVEPSKSE